MSEGCCLLYAALFAPCAVSSTGVVVVLGCGRGRRDGDVCVCACFGLCARLLFPELPTTRSYQIKLLNAGAVANVTVSVADACNVASLLLLCCFCSVPYTQRHGPGPRCFPRLLLCVFSVQVDGVPVPYNRFGKTVSCAEPYCSDPCSTVLSCAKLSCAVWCFCGRAFVVVVCAVRLWVGLRGGHASIKPALL